MAGNRGDHRAALAELIDAFPRDRVSEGTGRVYLKHLADLPTIAVARAIHTLIRTCDRFPTIHQIREVVVELTLALPTETEALLQAGSREAHPAVKEALDAVGGRYAWRTCENPSVLQGQFLRVYKEHRAKLVREALLNAPLALEPGRPDIAVS